MVFGRRPGAFFQPFDFHTGDMLPIVAAKPERHFYGHGVFSPDGQLLYATEGEKGSSRGSLAFMTLLEISKRFLSSQGLA